MKAKVGFMGLGIMGSAMAANILKAGYPLTVYNRTTAKADPLAQLGARVAASPKALADDSAIVIAMVTGPEALYELLFGPQGAAELYPATRQRTGPHGRPAGGRPGVGHQEAGGGRDPGDPGQRQPTEGPGP